MKKVKILLLLLVVTASTFYSCSDNNPVENEVVATKSISLRTTLNALKRANNINGKSTLDQSTCFNFVFPLTFSYNNGTLVSVESYEGLVEILTNETADLYVVGIAFPFQVQEEGTITTINNEAEFYLLIDQCAFQTVNECIFDITCYDIVYPIFIVNANNQTVQVNNQTELMQLLSNPNGTNTYQLDIVFPISVTQNNQTIVINDLYEFLNLNDDCNASSCNCPADYSPVCVQTPTGIVEYSNACFAQCDGFTPNDFVDCGNPNPCPCPTNYIPVCVQTANGIVEFTNACVAACAGYTIDDFIDCGAPTNDFGSLLGSCLTISYPVSIQYQGALVTLNSDSELLQYYFPAVSPIPAFSYPVNIILLGSSSIPVIVNNQADFQLNIDTHCN